MKKIIIIGGGLSGNEAAWQAAQAGLHVNLYEMRPHKETGAHQSGDLAELICSNSLGSNLPDRASGLLKNELRRMDSMLLAEAEASAVPAGGALAVDRQIFAKRVTEKLEKHPNIQIFREEVTAIPATPAIIASGPLTSEPLSRAIAALTGEDHLYFFDAIAPIIYADSIDMSIAFRASRYDRGDKEQGDYINCPFTKEEYDRFYQALIQAERIQLHSFERQIEEGVKAGAHHYFEGCLPAEIIAQRGEKSLAFGPLRPVGLTDPRTGKRPYAVLQLRQDNLAGDLYNMVGFQTNLKFPEQRHVFRLIPGLENARFARYGQMHRNTFINSPNLLKPTLQFHSRETLFFAGQITGVEGYIGNVATGLLAGKNIARLLNGSPLLKLPQATMLGALCHYITHAAPKDFQPMKANFGILPPLPPLPKGGKKKRGKRERAALRAQIALAALDDYLDTVK